MSEDEVGPISRPLGDYYQLIEKDPADPKIWQELFSKALDEEKAGKKPDWLSGISCADLQALHETVINAQPDQRLAILANKAPSGKLWYEHILGTTNRKSAEFLLDFIDDHDYEAVIESGTGSGDTLVQPRLDRKVFGMDISLSYLKSAAYKFTSGLFVSDAKKVAVTPKSADCIYSHGLTRYLSLPDLESYANEVKRILKPGGVYLELQTLKEGDEIPKEEKYLTENHMSLLILALDRLVTDSALGTSTKFEQWVDAFKSQGFDLTMHRNGNNIVFEFRKPYTENLENARSDYLRGDSEEAESSISVYLFPHKYQHHVKGQLVSYRPLSLVEWNQRMEEYRQFGKDERIIQGSTETRDYLHLCISPLIAVIQGQQYSTDFQLTAVNTLEQNVQVFIDKVINLTSDHWSHKKDHNILAELKKDLQGNPLCNSLVQKIANILAG